MQGVAEDEGTMLHCKVLRTVSYRLYLALDALSALTVQDKPADIFSTPPQLDGELVTFTLLPRSRWQTLLNLEVIQQRNKPKEPPKQPDKAPFFLPTLPGVEHRFAPEANIAEEAKKPTKRLQRAAGSTESVFNQKLAEAHESESADCTYTIHCLWVDSIDLMM